MPPITNSFLNQTHNCTDNFRTYFAIKANTKPQIALFRSDFSVLVGKPKVE